MKWHYERNLCTGNEQFVVGSHSIRFRIICATSGCETNFALTPMRDVCTKEGYVCMYESVVISGRAFRRSEYASMLPGMGLPFRSTGATVSKDFSLSTSTRTRTERLSNSGRQKLIRDFDSLPSITEKQRSLPGGIGHWSPPQPMIPLGKDPLGDIRCCTISSPSLRHTTTFTASKVMLITCKDKMMRTQSCSEQLKQTRNTHRRSSVKHLQTNQNYFTCNVLCDSLKSIEGGLAGSAPNGAPTENRFLVAPALLVRE